MELIEYKPGDEREILDLFLKAFKKPLSPAFWEWRFGTNPFFRQPLISLMWEDKVLAGHYAVSGTELSINEQIHLFSLSGTTMTRPGFEGKGIFPSLAADVYERAAQDFGISGVMGFPNNKSHYALVKKIHWKDVNVIPGFSIACEKIGNNQPFKIHKINRFDQHHADFIRKSIENLGFSVFVNRSVTYLNWRYIECPVNTYSCFELRSGDEIAGIMICKSFDSFGRSGAVEVDLLEFFSNQQPQVIAAMLTGIKDFYISQNTAFQCINMWMPIMDPRHLLLEKLGFSIGVPLTFFCAKAFISGLDPIYDYRNWYLSLGDSDVF